MLKRSVEEVIEKLDYHNLWRRGLEHEKIDPRELGIIIDHATKYLKKYLELKSKKDT